jgi:hypothetical protein
VDYDLLFFHLKDLSVLFKSTILLPQLWQYCGDSKSSIGEELDICSVQSLRNFCSSSGETSILIFLTNLSDFNFWLVVGLFIIYLLLLEFKIALPSFQHRYIKTTIKNVKVISKQYQCTNQAKPLMVVQKATININPNENSLIILNIYIINFLTVQVI